MNMSPELFTSGPDRPKFPTVRVLMLPKPQLLANGLCTFGTYPKDLLRRVGYKVLEPENSHLCCGSAGTYNLMQPEISGQLKARKIETLEAKTPDVISAGNLGCMMQIGSGTDIPIMHTVELLDWATGGPKPRALSDQPAAGQVPILR
jgi:glycolate oxidase iron-sulfur subunit